MLNDFDPFLGTEGQNLTVNIGGVIFFCISGTNFCPIDERHTITLESLNPAAGSATISVTIRVASTPKEYTIYLNVPLEIDVDGDGIPDIRVTLLSLTDKYALINFVSLRAGPKLHLLGTMGVGG